MENQTGESGGVLLAKIAGLWAVVGITSWSEAASFAAFCYTMWLMGAKFWKEVLRPICERRGWVSVRPAAAGERDDG
ncbi:holin [Burkholderia phage BcepMigl]|nr:holin [Burkholderia phage BcepMigl]AFN39141.1 holin [Burkholderia phage BcepMigl]